MSDAIRVQEIRHFNVIWMMDLKYQWIDYHKCGKSRDEKIHKILVGITKKLNFKFMSMVDWFSLSIHLFLSINDSGVPDHNRKS